MEKLLETIKIVDGIPQNIIYHNQRFNRSRRHFFETTQAIDLYHFLKVPPSYATGTVRARIIYSQHIEDIQYAAYQKKEINNLKLINTNIEYDFKYLNRQVINELYAKRELADDVLLVKQGYITDSSYANLVFKNTKGLFTPKQPLLAGTKRQKLLDEKQIHPLVIGPEMLAEFSHFCLINAFLDLDETAFLPISNIIF
jgi:4-amino-4-deoxychorismate lyase